MITPKQYEKVEKEIDDWYGLKIPYVHLKKAIDTDEYVKEEIEKNYVEDTAIREGVIEAISQYLIGKHWPIGGDTERYSQEFYDELDTKIKEIGGRFDREQYRED